MRIAAILAAVLWSAAPAHAGTEEFSVITGGNRVGHVTATTQGDAVSIAFDVKNNGRGPTIAEVLRVDTDGLPLSWAVTGATTFGNKVDERYTLEGGQAQWKDASGEGRQPLAQPRMYVTQSGSPWALGFYSRALLAAPERRLPVLPAGELALEEGKTLQVSDGTRSLTVRQYAISGIELDPAYLLLDEDRALFAVISPSYIVIRKGFEAEEVRLRQLAADLGEQRLQDIQAKTAHNYGAPVRIRNVRVFNPETGTLGEPVSVLVNGRRIASVQPLDAPATPGEVRVEGEGGSLVPGLYEMHAHTGQDDSILNIAAGVTSFRDMGNDNAVLDGLIASIEAGTIAGPRITRSGFIEGKSPFNSNNGILVNSEAETLAAVRWYAARGYHQVKLYNSMKPEWSAAAVKEAHRLGLRATGHIPAFSNADAMIAAGYDELTHINQVMLGWVLAPEEDTRTLLRLTALKRLATLDLASPRVRTTLDSIVARKVAVEPTIAIHENLMLNQNGQVPRGQADYIDNLPVGEQRDARQAWSDMSTPGDAAAYAAAFEKLMATLREMRERGVLLVPGTDLGGGLTYHRELQLFEQLGYTPAQVLTRATLDMARYLDQDQSLGSIEPGKLADFFLVAGDPTADLAAIKKIRMVVKDGTVYYPSEIYPNFGIRPFATAPAVTLPEGAADRPE